MKLNHKQIVEDYRKLIKMYAVPYDLTGGMVVEDFLQRAVEIGTKQSCANAILEIIKYGFQCSDNQVYRYQYNGGYREISVDKCEFVKYISDTYLQF